MKKIYRILGVILLLLLIYSCKKDQPNTPGITTTAINEISYTIASGGGIVANDGGATVVSRGVCWNTSANPTVSNNITTEPGDLGTFVSKLTNLLPNTNYYVKAYATNSAGTGYGDQVTFTTNQVAVPLLTTTPITSITQTTAVSGGNITADNGGSVTQRGICWSINQNPTTANDKTTDGTDMGSFLSNLIGLNSGTTYYVRSYATNSSGTSYGNEISFTTQQASIPILSTASVTAITQTTATSGGTVTSDGSQIIDRGLCWSSTQNPTISDNTVSSGSGSGDFTISISGLNGNTDYYVRAYATNNMGTGYGNQITFKTSPKLPTLSTEAVSSISFNSCNTGGNIMDDGGAPVIERGVCWSTSENPTLSNSKSANGSGIGPFINLITGLEDNTTYFIRAYATNNIGTQYGNQVSLTTYPTTINDIDENLYNTVLIGTQLWMKENLKTTKYQNGESIATSITPFAISTETSPHYQWFYLDNVVLLIDLGRLYTWYVVNDSRNVCPSGWHIPSNSEWTTLTTTLGGESVAGGKLKGNKFWLPSNSEITNESGFTAYPGGLRADAFSEFGTVGLWWTANGFDAQHSWYFRIDINNKIDRPTNNNWIGMSIRCLKDN